MPQSIRIRAVILPPLTATLLLAALFVVTAHAQSVATVDGQAIHPVSIVCSVASAQAKEPDQQTISVGPAQKLDDLCPESRRVEVKYHVTVYNNLPPLPRTAPTATGHPP